MKYHTKMVLLVLFVIGLFSSFFANSAETRPSFDAGVLNIPELQVGSEVYTVKLNLIDPASLTLQVEMSSLKNITELVSIGGTKASYDSGILIIPQLQVGTEIYSVKFELIDPATLTVQVDLSSLVNISRAANLFNDLDAVLAQKVVTTDSPEGLWLIYSNGTTNSSLILEGTATNKKSESINLFAFVASVYQVIDKDGQQRIHLSGCTGSSFSNNLALSQAAIVGSLFDDLTDEFSITLSQLNAMNPSSFPYSSAGGVLFNDNMDQEVIVSLINNREMVFTSNFVFTKTDGDLQGSVTAAFKGKKISDDIMANLGSFEVNSIAANSHCYSYTKTQNVELQELVGFNTTRTTYTQEEYSFQSSNAPSRLPSYTLTFLNRGPHAITINDQVSPDIPGFRTGSYLEVPLGDFFQVRSDTSDQQVDFNIDQRSDLSITIDYSIGPGGGAEPKVGSIEVGL